MKILKEILLEALNSEQKEFVDMWHRGDYSFSNHAFGNKDENMVTRIPLPKSNMGEIESKVHEHLNNLPFDDKKHVQRPAILSYKNNKAINNYGKETSLTSMLKKNKGLLDEYNKDPAREAQDTGNQEYYVKISRHPHDVAAMSTGQNWTSCMDMDYRGGVSGCNRSYLPKDIEHGTHVAYLHKVGDDEEKDNPVARIAIKPWTKGDMKTLSPEQNSRGIKEYGSTVNGFGSTVKSWLKDNNFPDPTKESGWTKHRSIYDDTHEQFAPNNYGGEWRSVGHLNHPLANHYDDDDEYYEEDNEEDNAREAHENHMSKLRNGTITDNENYHRIGDNDYDNYMHGYNGEEHQDLIHGILTSPHHFPEGAHPMSQRTFDEAMEYYNDLDDDKKDDVAHAVLKHHSHLLKNDDERKFDITGISNEHINDIGEKLLHSHNVDFDYGHDDIEKLLNNSPSLKSGNPHTMEDFIHNMAKANAHEIRNEYDIHKRVDDFYEPKIPKELENIRYSGGEERDLTRMLKHPNQEFVNEAIRGANKITPTHIDTILKSDNDNSVKALSYRYSLSGNDIHQVLDHYTSSDNSDIMYGISADFVNNPNFDSSHAKKILEYPKLHPHIGHIIANKLSSKDADSILNNTNETGANNIIQTYRNPNVLTTLSENHPNEHVRNAAAKRIQHLKDNYQWGGE